MEVTENAPLTVEAPRSIAPVSLSVTLFALVTPTVEKLLLLSKVMLLATPAAKVVVPVTVRAPLSVMAPREVTASVPLTVEVPRSIAPVSLRATLLPFAIKTEPPKSFALSRVISLAAPAAKVVVPPTVRVPVSLMRPVVEMLKLPVTFKFPAKSTAPAAVTIISTSTAAFPRIKAF